MVNFISSDAAQVVALGIEEQAFDQGAGIGGRRRIAWTQAAINVLQRFLFIFRRVLLHAFDDDAIINRGIDDFDFADAQLANLFDHCFGERLESAGDDNPFVRINGVLDQNFVLDVLKLLSFPHA